MSILPSSSIDVSSAFASETRKDLLLLAGFAAVTRLSTTTTGLKWTIVQLATVWTIPVVAEPHSLRVVLDSSTSFVYFRLFTPLDPTALKKPNVLVPRLFVLPICRRAQTEQTHVPQGWPGLSPEAAVHPGWDLRARVAFIQLD